MMMFLPKVEVFLPLLCSSPYPSSQRDDSTSLVTAT